MVAVTIAGKGWAKSASRSIRPEEMTLSMSPLAMDSISLRIDSTLRGVNAAEQIPRRRAGMGGSMNNICWRIMSANGFMKESPSRSK